MTEEEIERDFIARAKMRHTLEQHVPQSGTCKTCLIKQAARDIYAMSIGRELEVPKAE